MTNSFNLSYDRAHPSGWWHMECGTLFGTRGTETSLCEEPSQTWLLIQTNSSSYKTCRYSAFKSQWVRKLLISSNVFVKFACYCKLTNSWYWSGDCYIRAKMICWLQIIPAYFVFGKLVFVWHFQFQLQRQSHEGRSSCVQTCWNASTISWQGIHIINIHLCNNCSLFTH